MATWKTSAFVVGWSLAIGSLLNPSAARADTVAYLVNVTVRPGYQFPNADAALSYGHALCDKVATGEGYADLTADVQRDFSTSDYYQAAYLINQAGNELCPDEIFKLRNSAANYTLPPGN
jgi:hypothetical protein